VQDQQSSEQRLGRVCVLGRVQGEEPADFIEHRPNELVPALRLWEAKEACGVQDMFQTFLVPILGQGDLSRKAVTFPFQVAQPTLP
jgi:hypothetical protein